MTKPHNAQKTCWNCPAAKLEGNVDFRACGQSKEEARLDAEDKEVLIECKRRPELGHFQPTITFEQCPQWEESKYGFRLKNMSVLVLGMDGYLGWPLSLKLANLGFDVAGIDNYTRREATSENDSHSIVPIYSMDERLEAAKEVLGVDLKFREMDYTNREELKGFMEEFQPESIVHYAEIPSAPYSMVNADHSIEVQRNNVLGTLGLLWAMKEVCPEASLVKLGTMGEYGSPITGRPLFEGMFPSDAVLEWEGREWSMGGELTPRNPPSFYHVSKVNDTYNIYEACKYWWLRSFDVMQGVIFGVHTEEVSRDPRLRTRLDVDECVPPDTQVCTNFDMRPIEKVNEGDRVLTHKGRFRKVTDTFVRDYSGDVVKIDVPYVEEELTFTSNHPILVVEKDREVVDGQNQYSYSDPFWMNAEDLLDYSMEASSDQAENLEKYKEAMKLREEKGLNFAEIARKFEANYHTVRSWFKKDRKPHECKRKKMNDLYLVKPIPSETQDKKKLDFSEEIDYGIEENERLYTPNPANPQEKWGKGIPSKIDIDEHFMRFAGYYLAEGSGREYDIVLTFGADEKPLIEEAEKALDHMVGRFEKRDRDSKTSVKVSSKAFAKLIEKLFNFGARSKEIPDFMLRLPLSKQKELIKSYWKGDGWENEKRENEPAFFITSASKKLIKQVQMLLLRFGIIGGMKKREREVNMDFEGRDPYTIDSEQYQLSITGTNARKFARKILDREIDEPYRSTEHTKWIDDRCLIPIRDIWKESYEGEVLNLEVEEDNSYTVSGQAVHNCFGTVVNRFASQAASDIPLTVYGKGEQTRGFIALEDAMQCMVRLISSPPEPGQYDVVNQVSGVYKIKELADTVGDVGSENHSLDVEIQRLENPRVEADKHPFEAVSRKLPNEFGFERKVSLRKEIDRMLDLLTEEHVQERIEGMKHAIMPETQWSGEKEEPDIIEVYDPGEKDLGIYEPKLDTGKEDVEMETEEAEMVEAEQSRD